MPGMNAIKEKQNIVAAATSNIIQEQFNDMMEDLKTHLYFISEVDTKKGEELLEKETAFIESIELGFENSPHLSRSAYASSNYKWNKELMKRVNEYNRMVFNAGDIYDYRSIIIHELAHLIVDFYDWVNTGKHNGFHCLEFAIITYCIQWDRMREHNRYNKTFFRAYDIHEDIAFPNLSINACKFDSMVKCIEWNSLQDLARQASNLAEKIRKKLVM
jgi:hypothetical protein